MEYANNPLTTKEPFPHHKTTSTRLYLCCYAKALLDSDLGLYTTTTRIPLNHTMMNSLFDTKISYYSNVEDNVGKEISLRDFLFCDRYKEQIEAIRSITDENVQKSLKKQLPLATISGIFAPTRKAVNLVAHSNLLCIDIDKKDNMGVSWFDDMIYEHRRWLLHIVDASMK